VFTGIAISATQPSLTMRAALSQTPSQLRLTFDVVPRPPPSPVEHLLLQLGAERRRQEHVAVARVVEGVDDDLEVVLVEEAVRIAAHLGGDDRFGSIGVDADVDVLVVVEDTDFGAIARRLSFVRFLLRERVDGSGGLPDGFVEDPVDLRRVGRLAGVDRRAFAACLREGCGGDRQSKRHDVQTRKSSTAHPFSFAWT
jgi:hypothetical protein